MSFNQFTNLDFNNLKIQIKDYLRANSNFTDYDFEGSNFSTLIDVLAYNSYITAYNTNMAVNESFIDSATLRENVVSLARNIGYVPRSRRCSRAIIQFTVNVSNLTQIPKTITLKAGIVALGSMDSGNYIFSIPQNTTSIVDNDGIATFKIEIYEGSYLTKTFVMNSAQTNQKFILPNIGVDTSTIRTIVTGKSNEEYEYFSNIFEVDKNSKIFLIQEAQDEKYEIIFGDDIIGKKPMSGSTITISYIVTNGSYADGAANFTFSGILYDNNNTIITSGISLITTIQASENGDEIEPTDSVKYLSSRVYSSQYRAVTANDYKGLIPYLFPNVESVTSYGGEELDPPEYGKVFISVKPRNGSFLSQITKEEIKRKLKQYSIAGIKPELVDLKYLYVELDTSVYYNKSLESNVSTLKSSVLNTLKSYSKSSEINSFGGRFKYSKIGTLIDNTSYAISSNITKVKIRRDLQPVYNKLSTYELCFGNQFHIKRSEIGSNIGYNIKSTGFTIKDITQTLYMTDVPIDDSTGTIVFFKLDNGVPFIISNNSGTVDYMNGEIRLTPVIFTSSINSNGIQIQAIPESNDVIALKDIYLEVNIPNTTVSMIEDTISSGENLSATQYAVTSSYTEGLYTR
jgi:hypothetical protein